MIILQKLGLENRSHCSPDKPNEVKGSCMDPFLFSPSNKLCISVSQSVPLNTFLALCLCFSIHPSFLWHKREARFNPKFPHGDIFPCKVHTETDIVQKQGFRCRYLLLRLAFRIRNKIGQGTWVGIQDSIEIALRSLLQHHSCFTIITTK